MKFWVVISGITWVLIAAVLLVIAIGWGIPKYTQYGIMQRQRAAKLEEKQLLEAKVSRLQLNRQRLTSDPAFVERTAHNEGMVKSNETVCKLTDKP